MDVEKFVPPSPGAWEIEATHMQRPISRWLNEFFGAQMMRGFKEATARYGALLSHLDVATIGGFIYMCPRPVGAPKGAKGPPPKLVFKLLAKLHPEIRRRIKRSREVFEGKLWREDVERWDREIKPRIVKRNAELAAVEPTKLDAPALIAHLRELEERIADAIYIHHSMNLVALLPVGDFLAHAAQWTGKPPTMFCALLRGASPVSNGATAELERAMAAISADAEASKRLASTAPAAEIVEGLRAAGGAVGEAMTAYLAEVGLRPPSGYDVSEPTTLELPAIIVGALRTGAKHDLGAAKVAADIAAAREAVPAEHRAEFDELLAEAKLVYRIRDERTYLNDLLASGLCRRAILAAGDLLVAKGALRSRDHAVDLTPGELRGLLAGQPGPTADEVAGRATYRTTHTCADAPAHLGLPPSPPPPAEWLPPHAARSMRAINVVLAAMFDVAEKKKTDAKVVRGLAASPGTYEGRARVVLGAEQFSKVEQGDVLIARTTCPSYNVLLPLLGGIVTDRGGLLSHAAIVAREYGMPAVVGTSEATKLIIDGARVRVDGATGEVQVLS